MMTDVSKVLYSAFGPLAPNQVAGIATLLKASEGLPLRHRAYILATAWHETGPASSKLHMTPRKEIWGPTKAQLRYEGNVKSLGNTHKGDGKKFLGRGFVQITGRANYAKASVIVGQDLVASPDFAMNSEIAAKIIVHGMKNGWFTGKGMADFTSYKDMRRVVNGTDKAAQIAEYAEEFEKVLKMMEPAKPVPASPVPPSPVPPSPVPPSPVPPSPIPPSPVPPSPTVDAGKGVAASFLAAVAALVAFLVYWVTKGGN